MTTEASSYAPLYPASIPVQESVKEFISRFYAISDDPDRNEEWVGSFVPDGTLAIGGKEVKGLDDIRQVRQGMWEKVRARKHRPERVYPAGTGGFGEDKTEGEREGVVEYMLHGSLLMGMKDGSEKEVVWAGRAKIRKDVAATWKFVYYQIFVHAG